MKQTLHISENVKCAFLSALIVGTLTYLTFMVLQPVSADPILFENWFKPGEWQLINQGRWAAMIFTYYRGESIWFSMR